MGRKLTDPVERAKVAAQLAARYNAGATLRQLVAETGFSYGKVHELVTTGRADIRPIGAPRRTSD